MLQTPPQSAEIEAKAPPSPGELVLPPSLLLPPAREATSPAPRRRNHSEIEKRRREKINAKYTELKELIPACRKMRFAKRGGDSGLHKLDILTEAVLHIRELKAKCVKEERAKLSYLMN